MMKKENKKADSSLSRFCSQHIYRVLLKALEIVMFSIRLSKTGRQFGAMTDKELRSTYQLTTRKEPFYNSAKR